MNVLHDVWEKKNWILGFILVLKNYDDNNDKVNSLDFKVSKEQNIENQKFC